MTLGCKSTGNSLVSEPVGIQNVLAKSCCGWEFSNAGWMGIWKSRTHRDMCTYCMQVGNRAFQLDSLDLSFSKLIYYVTMLISPSCQWLGVSSTYLSS